MKIKKILILTTVVLFCLAARQDAVLRVKAIGKASPRIIQKSRARAAAYRAATIEAYKKMAAAAGFSQTYQSGNQKYIRVEAFITGALLVDKRYITDYEVEVTMEIPRAQLVQQVKKVKKSVYKKQISETKHEIKAVRDQIQQLTLKLSELKKMLKELEVKANEES
ncbi:MAG: hypothetical protein PVH61_12295 [Candidatus Aminicenantes bacterium]